jgi:hypothetical protein
LLQDSGLNVRKRVIKLLRDIYNQLNPSDAADRLYMVDIIIKFLKRVTAPDEEQSIRDLTLRCLNDMLFSSFSTITFENIPADVSFSLMDFAKRDPSSDRISYCELDTASRMEVRHRVCLLVDVAKVAGKNGVDTVIDVLKMVLCSLILSLVR